MLVYHEKAECASGKGLDKFSVDGLLFVEFSSVKFRTEGESRETYISTPSS